MAALDASVQRGEVRDGGAQAEPHRLQPGPWHLSAALLQPRQERLYQGTQVRQPCLVNRFGPAVRRWAGKERGLGSIPLRLSSLSLKKCCALSVDTVLWLCLSQLMKHTLLVQTLAYILLIFPRWRSRPVVVMDTASVNGCLLRSGLFPSGNVFENVGTPSKERNALGPIPCQLSPGGDVFHCAGSWMGQGDSDQRSKPAGLIN